MRSEATNTWSEGMVKDLNPINTPNNVLTDCLNGTIITYDGNEYSLQNDRGNYPLNNCKLPKNYIPVGLKEYAGILYIISYNPLTESTQIGTYPSVAQVTSTDRDTNIEMIEPIQLNSSDYPTVKFKYHELVENNCSLKAIYGDNPDEYKLNPGDKYKLSTEYNTSDWKYQDINYYILSEDKKLYDISNLIFSGEKDSNGYRTVSWGIPGWLAMQLKIAEIDDCTISLNGSPKMPAYLQDGSTASTDFRITINTSDPLIYTKTSPELFVEWTVTCSSDSSFIKTGTSQLTKSQNIYNGSYSYRCTTGKIEGIPISKDSTITVTVIPRLCNMEYGEVTMTYNISNKNEIETFNIGNDKWWYYTSREEELLNIQFSIEGLEGLSLAEDLSLKYTLYKICNDGSIKIATDSFGEEISNRQVEDWVPGNVEGEISLKLLQNSSDSDSSIEPESMYIIRFDLYSSEIAEPLKTLHKLIIASELLNKVTSNRYDTVNFDTWFDKYENTVKDGVISITNIENPDWGENPKAIITSEGAKGAWNTDIDSKDYPCFLETSNFKQVSKSGFKITASLEYKINTTYTSPISLLHGPMWNNTLNNLNITFNSNSGIGELFIDKSTGKIENSKSLLSNTIPGKYSKTVSYIPELLTNYDTRIWTYLSEDNLKSNDTIQYITASVKEVDKKNNTSTLNINTSAGSYILTSTNTSLTISSIQSLALLLKSYGALLVRVGVSSGAVDTNGIYGAVLYLKYGKEEISINTNDRKGTKFRYFLIIPASSDYKKIQLILLGEDEDTAKSIYNEVCSSISRIKCNDDAFVGGFITMQQDISQPIYPNTSIQLTGNFNPSIFNYAGINLLNQDGRDNLKSLIRDKVGDEIVLTNLDSSNYVNAFPIIKLEDKVESLSFSFDTSLIDTELENESKKVSDRNEKISNQYYKFLSDEYLNGPYTETTDLYFLKDASLSKYNSIINVLNSKSPSSYNKADFYTYNWHNGDHTENAKTASIGYFDSSITIS